MSAWAKPGVKCVCILSDDRVWGYTSAEDAAPGPEYGEICTVRSVGSGRIQLVGYWPEDDGYPTYCFRPLITKTQEEDVSMFLEILQKQEEPA